MNRRTLAKTQLPPMELAILQVLWACGSGSVVEIRDQLEGDPAYTTVQTILNKMTAKRRLKRRIQGRTYIYSPAIAKERALREASRDLLKRFFNGNVVGLMLSIVENEQIDPASLDRIELMLKAKREEGS